MLIVADENIPFAREAFGTLGQVQLMHGRELTSASVRQADALIVRSVTRVDRILLEGSRVRFVGTATIGTDHVDLDYLRKAGIEFAAAPGSNANSVAEYVVAALLVIARRLGWRLAGRSIGVVGVGNVGSRVAAKAQALGMRVLLNDPPLQRATKDPKYLPLEAMMECDVITLHTPLEKGGSDPTWHLADGKFLSRMRRDAVLVNTSRGAVADNAALLSALESGRIAAAVLDVWEGEPNISAPLLQRAAIATPHIAGYSYDGKVAGTEMVYRAACRFFGVRPTWEARGAMEKPQVADLTLQPAGDDEEVLRQAVLTVYPIERDDAALRKLLELPPGERGAYFDRLRKEYPIRREFHNTLIRGAGPAAAKLSGLGFICR